METPTTPRVSLDLVEWLEKRALARCPDAETATDNELRAYVAETRLVRQLRGIYNEQTNPPEE